MREEIKKKLEARKMDGLEGAIEDLAKELRKERRERVGRMVEAIALLGEKVLVPILCAVIGAFATYYVELAKSAKDAGREAAVEELERAEEAEDFVERHLPEVAPPAPVGSSALAQPRAALQRLLEIWETEQAAQAMMANINVSSEDGTDAEPKPEKMDKPPVKHIERAFRKAQMQMQEQEQEQFQERAFAREQRQLQEQIEQIQEQIQEQQDP